MSDELMFVTAICVQWAGNASMICGQWSGEIETLDDFEELQNSIVSSVYHFAILQPHGK